MKTFKITIFATLTIIMMQSCEQPEERLMLEVYETSASGNKLTKVESFMVEEENKIIKINPAKTFQKITGFGGSFTESSAYLLNQLSEANRKKILDAYFGPNGARYSLTRTHINSSDFSLSQYAYVTNDDKDLSTFSLDEDREDIIPMIKEAMDVSEDGFKIVSSPWTAPPFMKDNNDWVGGKLHPDYYASWALYFSKYIDAYKKEGIDIWGITVENEPLGNGNNWESMHYTPEEMTDFVVNHLGPQLEKAGQSDVKILGYDQNREHLKEWVDEMYRDEASTKYFDGTAIHWYASTFAIFEEELQYAHQKAPNKHLIQTEACVDAEVPKWQNDDWYWSKEGTDWGYDWAPDDQKAMHPKYVPTYRYARDIIGCLNNHVDGWIDWNMVLNRQGGPNWFENWCVAPIIVDPEQDEVYLTPIYYVMSHFSRFIRPEAQVIAVENPLEDIMVTSAKNPDGSIAVVIFNPNDEAKSFQLSIDGRINDLSISKKAIQTVIVNL